MPKRFIPIIVLVIIAVIAYAIITPYITFVTKTLGVSIFKTTFPGKIIQTVDNTVNILILGIPGGTHDGPNLSDSMMVAHYDFTTNKLALIGLPRDLWSDTLKEKINTAYAIGEAKRKGGGLTLAKAEIGAIVGVPIEYAVAINFQTFERLIDYVGGVDVTIEHTFTDTEYPIEGRENDTCSGDPEYRCRYQTVSFTKGNRHMDGKTALIFSRSRHAVGSEGSDFARSRRQQIVIAGLKEKILAIARRHDVHQMEGLYKEVNALIERDITNQQLAVIAKNIALHKNFTQFNIPFPQDYFEVPAGEQYGGAYVLVPPDEDFAAFHQYVQCMYDNQSESSCSSLLK